MSLTPCLTLLLAAVPANDPPEVRFDTKPGEVVIKVKDQAIATYFYDHKEVKRPGFSHVKTPGGIQVTRNFPPRAPGDAVDHATMHPGIWMAFGDVSGHDFWRNKGRVEHVKFAEEPRGGKGRGSFAVVNRYVSADGKTEVCRQTARYTVVSRPDGWLLVCASEFRSDAADLTFGSQEEMGLGVRIASPLRVKGGQGTIRNSQGGKNEKDTWGKETDWLDYSGLIDGRHVGVTIMASPKTARKSWAHSRDYGVMVMNPFPLKPGKDGPTTVKKGESFRLGYGVLVHESKDAEPVDVKAAYKDYLDLLKE
jgi:hypothetical protein